MNIERRIEQVQTQMSHASGKRWHELAAELYRLWQFKRRRSE